MSSKRQQTMAKMARERSVKERRARKQEKKLERKLEKELAASGGGERAVDETAADVDGEQVVEEIPVAATVD